LSAISRLQHESLVSMVRKLAQLAGLDLCPACHRELYHHGNVAIRRCADALRFTHVRVFAEHLALEQRRKADRAAAEVKPMAAKRAPRRRAA
jgi:hypothetical protein